jgi:hypothetical protein
MNLKPASAFTRVDLAILVAAAGMLALWLFYGSVGLHRRPRHAARVTCTINLKQVALAFCVWEVDRDLTNFPWEVGAPIGTASGVRSNNVFWHFAAISNELQNLRVLTCPADKARKPATSWGALRNENISYFINVTPSLDVQSVTVGDRDLGTNSRPLGGYNVISDAKTLQWTKVLHEHGGNVALAEGSAHQITTQRLQDYFTNTPIHLAFP